MQNKTLLSKSVQPQKKISFWHKFLYSPKYAPYVFVMPFIIVFCVFFLYPTITTIMMSMQKISGFNDVKFIGLDNYKRLWNEDFFNAIRNSTLYTICMVFMVIPFPMVFATLLNMKKLRGRNIFRSILFVPTLTSVIVAGVVFRFLLFSDLETGIINSVMKLVGLPPQNWSMQYWSGTLMMVALSTWRVTGVNVVYCLSSLQTIPEELYESADIDGANNINKFMHITFPMMRPILIYLLTVAIVDGYRMFTEGYVFWNESTPGSLGLTIVRYIYMQAFQRNDLGFGSAIGIVLLVIILIINLTQLKSFGLFNKED